ncbi:MULTISPECIES: YopX family protein [unclassified Lysinibacillus]|uniref:YopX family protein n=1 Tax=unclassified Lysinibacillus TaxID=2636778 RepID=UPI00382BD479
MREIKFRAWMDNKILSHEDLVDMDQEFYAMYTILTEPQEDIAFMQYTGLKDKDDKEIYEGDIVLLKNEFATWKGTVVFEEGAFKFLIKHSWGTSVEHFNKTDVLNDMGARIQLNNIYVVVGNIYENPELLGESQ